MGLPPPLFIRPPQRAYSTVTWNPADKGAFITLSGGDLTATSTGPSGVRGTVSHTTGKRYYEAVLSGFDSGTNSPKVGVASSALLLNGNSIWYSVTLGGCGYPASDGVNPLHFYSNNGGPVDLNIGNFSDGDVVGVFVDFATGNFWLSRNGAIANSGNPAAGTGQTLTFTASTPLFPAAASGVSGSVIVGRWRADQWAYSSHGFVEW